MGKEAPTKEKLPPRMRKRAQDLEIPRTKSTTAAHSLIGQRSPNAWILRAPMTERTSGLLQRELVALRRIAPRRAAQWRVGAAGSVRSARTGLSATAAQPPGWQDACPAFSARFRGSTREFVRGILSLGGGGRNRPDPCVAQSLIRTDFSRSSRHAGLAGFGSSRTMTTMSTVTTSASTPKKIIDVVILVEL